MQNRIIYLIILMLGCSLVTKAQSTKLMAEVVPSGVFVTFPSSPKATERVIIWRNTGQGFESIASLTSPTTSAILFQRLRSQALLFPDFYSVNEQVASNLWQIIQSGKPDSIRKAGIPVILLAMGAAYLDTTKNLPRGTRYRVQLNEQKWDSEELEKSSFKALDNRIVFHHLQPANEAIRAEWRLQRSQQPALLEVYRQRIGIDSNFAVLKTDLGFERTVKADSLSVHLSDTTVLPGITYQYYLSGKDFLGRVITRSDTIRSIAGNRATVAGVTKLITRQSADSSGVELMWNKPAVHTLRSIRVFRSAYYDSGYVQIAVLPPADTAWVDRSSAMGANYYYQVIAQGAGDFAIPSLRVFGSYMNKSRLMPPTNVRARRDENGTLLNWKYTSFMNLLGFRVYRSRGINGRFEAISDVLPASRDTAMFKYVDNDRALNAGETYSYSIAAVGRNSVESPLSEIVQSGSAKKTILQAPLQVRSLQLDERQISVTWQDMSIIDPAVTGYHIYRKAMGVDSLKGFVRLSEMPITNANEFLDTPGSQGAWQYVIRSIGNADSSGFSMPTAIRQYVSKPLPPGRVQVFEQKSSVVLNWDGTQIPGIGKYHVYRASAGTAPLKIGSVPYGSKEAFEDKNVSGGQLYLYFVTTETLGGVESDRSQEIGIRPK
jgi:fibronectin type 3 domain-containing protein